MVETGVRGRAWSVVARQAATAAVMEGGASGAAMISCARGKLVAQHAELLNGDTASMLTPQIIAVTATLRADDVATAK